MKRILGWLLACWMAGALAQEAQIIDLPTRPGVTDRILVMAPAAPTASVVLISGGAGNVDIAGNGYIRHEGNFLVRSRALDASSEIDQAMPPPRRAGHTVEAIVDKRPIERWTASPRSGYPIRRSQIRQIDRRFCTTPRARAR